MPKPLTPQLSQEPFSPPSGGGPMSPLTHGKVNHRPLSVPGGVRRSSSVSTPNNSGMYVDIKPSPPSADNNNGDSLDTISVAQRVRDILSAHNIGQRQFARHVLGLSQGTVSELLSKPKPWDKLTEKGRESYRKMRQWADDDTNIIELKLSTPKNGKSHL